MKWQVISMILPLEFWNNQKQIACFFWKSMHKRMSRSWGNSSSMLWSPKKKVYFMLNSTTMFHCVMLFVYFICSLAVKLSTFLSQKSLFEWKHILLLKNTFTSVPSSMSAIDMYCSVPPPPRGLIPSDFSSHCFSYYPSSIPSQLLPPAVFLNNDTPSPMPTHIFIDR